MTQEKKSIDIEENKFLRRNGKRNLLSERKTLLNAFGDVIVFVFLLMSSGKFDGFSFFAQGL